MKKLKKTKKLFDFDDDIESFADSDERDYLGRKVSKGHTFTNNTNRFGYGYGGYGRNYNYGGYGYGSNYSSYGSRSIFGYNYSSGIDVSNITKVLNSMLTMIGIKNPKEKLSVTGAEKKESIRLALQYVENGKIKPEHENSFYGATLLNGCKEVYDKSHIDYASSAFIEAARLGSLDKYLSVLLNEERYQKKLADDYPGYSDFVEDFKKNAFSNFEDLEENIDSSDKEYYKAVKAVTKEIRYPSKVTDEEREKYGPLFKYVSAYLKQQGLGENAVEALTRGSNLAGEVLKYVNLPEKKQKEQQGADEDGNPVPIKGSTPSSENAQEAVKAMMQGLVSAGSNKDAKDASGENIKGGVGAGPSASDKDEERFLEKIKEEFFDSDDDRFNGNSTITFVKAGKNPGVYKDCLNKIDKSKAEVLRKSVIRKIKDYSFLVKSMRSGHLDTGKLAEAVQHVPTIYERTARKFTNKVTVGVLIDESGSMGGYEIEQARLAAIFICEAFGNIPAIDLYIYGHTADHKSHGSTDIHVYYESGKSGTHKYNLGSVRARSNNRDGVAIYNTAKRIRSFTENPTVLFVISDGAPAASGYSNGISHTREAVQHVEKRMKMNVVQIAINEYVPSEKMFKHFVKFTNIKELPNTLIRYLSKNLDRMIKETITM